MSGKPAARVSDPTACPLPGHGSNPIVVGSADVFFDGLAAARQGDASAWCCTASMPGSSMRSSEMGANRVDYGKTTDTVGFRSSGQKCHCGFGGSGQTTAISETISSR
ncbi:hypothetical protein J2Y72_000949 [Pseudomonas aeruginosa]|mgnify:FL=1|jgi:hypothetical protein|nr:hypothetical protein HV94_30040 [Pseudomonas aeruginosa]SCY51072.1 Uncharacterised protein [Acinetobacter baumannii]KSI13028.1 hypothetical protein AO984_11390 [Pseudomonas aeruginosa]KSP77897.1 hypothetical protein APB20_26795 [Pseudomonas aeruginosa]MCP1566646.1 hypothetical protein [Pseudomonas aeruginosa]